ncbi:MAG: uridine diphosphate-N-acetylglucosamine-binding protein YvcK [Actinomycetes bacterium]
MTATWSDLRPDGPEVVALGGGHGLSTTLRAVRTYAGSVTAVVSVADDGGSTGRLREASERAAPGDLRKCLAALAGHHSLLLDSMEHRFDAGELQGHAFGNLLIAALEEVSGDLVAALDEVGRLLGAVGRTLPSTTTPVVLHADVEGGAVVAGQAAVARTTNVHTVRLVPSDAAACPDAVDAILSAEQVILGPGSLFTSVLAAASVQGIAEALVATSAQLVYVCNLRPQEGETSGFGVADHVSALARHGIRPNVVLYDPDTMSGAASVAGAIPAAMSIDGGAGHDPALLGAALARVAVAS